MRGMVIFHDGPMDGQVLDVELHYELYFPSFTPQAVGLLEEIAVVPASLPYEIQRYRLRSPDVDPAGRYHYDHVAR